MRALVTGGAGFIGSAIARGLLERGDEVRVIDDLSSGREEDVPAGAELVVGDIRDLDKVRAACAGVQVVFHQAAVRSVPRSLETPLLTNETNVGGTLNILVSAADAGVSKVVYASSSSIYGDGGGAIKSEDLEPDPLSPYAVSKLAAEHYCRVWGRLGLVSTISLRYFNVFGPGQRADSLYAAVFPLFIASLVEGRPPEVHWDGEQSRSFTYIDDVVEANLSAGDAGSDANGMAINIAGGHSHTINQVLARISDELGTWIEPRRTPKRAGDIRSSRADTSRARELLGWESVAPWDEAVSATVKWFTDGSRAA